MCRVENWQSSGGLSATSLHYDVDHSKLYHMEVLSRKTIWTKFLTKTLDQNIFADRLSYGNDGSVFLKSCHLLSNCSPSCPMHSSFQCTNVGKRSHSSLLFCRASASLNLFRCISICNVLHREDPLGFASFIFWRSVLFQKTGMLCVGGSSTYLETAKIEV